MRGLTGAKVPHGGRLWEHVITFAGGSFGMHGLHWALEAGIETGQGCVSSWLLQSYTTNPRGPRCGSHWAGAGRRVSAVCSLAGSGAPQPPAFGAQC